MDKCLRVLDRQMDCVFNSEEFNIALHKLKTKMENDQIRTYQLYDVVV